MSLWPSHDQAELKKATPAGHNIGGDINRNSSFTVRHTAWVWFRACARRSSKYIQCQDFSVVSCSSKSTNINSTLLKCIGYNNVPILFACSPHWYLLFVCSLTWPLMVWIVYGRIAYSCIYRWVRIAYSWLAYDRIAYRHVPIAYGWIAYGRIAYGRIIYGRNTYGRIAYGVTLIGYATVSFSATVELWYFMLVSEDLHSYRYNT